MQKTIIMLLVAAACLFGVCMAEPQPVDGGWHRSDEVPVETLVETPTDALSKPEPEAAERQVNCIGLPPWDTLPEDEQMFVIVTAVGAGLFLIVFLYFMVMVTRMGLEGNRGWRAKR